MALTSSHHPTREWLMLFLTLLVVGGGWYPLWQALEENPEFVWAGWPLDRWRRLFLGPEQIACYVAFLWGSLILTSRFLEARRQRKAFALGLLPTEEGSRILHEDARPLQRKIDMITTQRGPFILANMIRQALAQFAVSRTTQDVSEVVRTQAEVDQGRLVTSLATVNYLAWAIPAIGFFGTVRGLAGSMTIAEQGGIRTAQQHLTVAFDCTLVALGLSLVAMLFIHWIQREEETLVIDCQQYCLEHLVNRLYEPEEITSTRHPIGEYVPGLSERVAR